MKTFDELVEIIAKLRDPDGGCPWDLKQTHETLKPYVIEESYELLEAIDSKNDDLLCDELGDVLLQVVLHAQLAKDRNAFTIEDVIQNLSNKMVRRHPHVFGDTKVSDENEVKKNWDKIKKEERSSKEKSEGIFDDIPKRLPALLRANKIGKKVSRQNFDWSDNTGVLRKIHEELTEVEEAIEQAPDNKQAISDEIGDLLFSVAQLARKLEIDPEDSLRTCCERFGLRYSKMLSIAGKDLASYSETELEELWQKAKSQVFTD